MNKILLTLLLAVFLVLQSTALNYVKIANVKPLTLHRYTEEYAKKFGDDLKVIHTNGLSHYKKYVHIAYHRKDKAWRTTYSSYEIPFTTMFGSNAKATACLKWLRDIEVI